MFCRDTVTCCKTLMSPTSFETLVSLLKCYHIFTYQLKRFLQFRFSNVAKQVDIVPQTVEFLQLHCGQVTRCLHGSHCLFSSCQLLLQSLWNRNCEKLIFRTISWEVKSRSDTTSIKLLTNQSEQEKLWQTAYRPWRETFYCTKSCNKHEDTAIVLQQ